MHVEDGDGELPVTGQGRRTRGGKQTPGAIGGNKTQAELDAELKDLVARAEQYLPGKGSPRRPPAPDTKLLALIQGASEDMVRGFFHMKPETFKKMAQDFLEVSTYETRGVEKGIGLVDGMLLNVSRMTANASWNQMANHMKLWSPPAMQRAVHRVFPPFADFCRRELERDSDFGAGGTFGPHFPTVAYMITCMELPLRHEDVAMKTPFEQYYLHSSFLGRACYRVFVAHSSRGLMVPMCVAGGRNNPGFVMQTSPEVLKMLSAYTLDVVDGNTGVRVVRRDLLIDPDSGIGDITETFPTARLLSKRAGVKAKDAQYNEDIGKLAERLEQTKEHVKLISQVLTVARASPDAATRPEDVVAAAFWIANMVRKMEGHIAPIPVGYVRTLPESRTDVSRDKTRVFPAPLKVFEPNVFTGVTPATLHLHAGRPLPRLHRTEGELQALLAEAYPDKA